MKAIVLYADKMQALATDSDDKELDSNSQTLAKNLNQLASTGGIHLNDPAIVQGVQAAIIEIGNMVLDQIKYKNIVTAAQKMQPHLEVIVTALKNENWGFGKAMSTSIALLEGQLRPLIIKSHEEKKADWANTFFNIVNGHILLMSVDPEADKSLTSLDNAAEPDLAKPVNDVLDAIVSGNKAIAAAKKTGGIYSAANDLYTRAIAAKDIYSSIGSSK